MKILRKIGNSQRIDRIIIGETERKVITECGVMDAVWLYVCECGYFLSNQREAQRLAECITAVDRTYIKGGRQVLPTVCTDFGNSEVQLIIEEDEIWWMFINAYIWTEYEPAGALDAMSILSTINDEGRAIWNCVLDRISQKSGISKMFKDIGLETDSLNRTMLTCYLNIQILMSQLWKICLAYEETGAELGSINLIQMIKGVCGGDYQSKVNLMKSVRATITSMTRVIYSEIETIVKGKTDPIPASNFCCAFPGQLSEPIIKTILNYQLMQQYIQGQTEMAEALQDIVRNHSSNHQYEIYEEKSMIKTQIKNIGEQMQFIATIVREVEGELAKQHETLGDMLNAVSRGFSVLHYQLHTRPLGENSVELEKFTKATARQLYNGLFGWETHRGVIRTIQTTYKDAKQALKVTDRNISLNPREYHGRIVMIGEDIEIDDTPAMVLSITTIDLKCREDWMLKAKRGYHGIVKNQEDGIWGNELARLPNAEMIMRRDWQWRSENFRLNHSKIIPMVRTAMTDSVAAEMRFEWWRQWSFKIIDVDIEELDNAQDWKEYREEMIETASQVCEHELNVAVPMVEVALELYMISILLSCGLMRWASRMLFHIMYTLWNVGMYFENTEPVDIICSLPRQLAVSASGRIGEVSGPDNCRRLTQGHKMLSAMQNIANIRDKIRMDVARHMQGEMLYEWVRSKLDGEVTHVIRKKYIHGIRTMAAGLDMITAIMSVENGLREKWKKAIKLLPMDPEIDQRINESQEIQDERLYTVLATAYEICELLT